MAIVGGGLAGLELAYHCSQNGLRDVVVVEAGPSDDVEHVYACHDGGTAARIWLEPEDADPYFARPWDAVCAPHFDGIAGLRRRLGGRSLYWHGILLPVEQWALGDWPAAVTNDLVRSWRGGTSLYDTVACELADWSEPSRETSESPALGPWQFKPAPRASREVRPGADRRWRAYGPLDRLTGVSPRSVQFVQASVTEVVMRAGHAHGVAVELPDGTRRTVEAEATVLAAGTIENSRLAIQALCEAHARSEPKLDGIYDHIGQGFVVRTQSGTADHLGFRLNTIYYLPLSSERSNLFLEASHSNGGDVIDVWAIGEQLPAAANYVACATTDEKPWRTYVRAGVSGDDLLVIQSQQRILLDVWRSLALELGLAAGGLSFGDFNCPQMTLSRATLMQHDDGALFNTPISWSSPLGTENHEGGTVRIGGVLNDDLEFSDVRGLFAVGPCVFPRMGAANPSLTTLALSRRLAGHLSERVRG